MPVASRRMFAAVVCFDAEGGAGPNPLHDVRQIVLRHRKGHRDRLHLGEHDDPRRAVGRDVVAKVDLS